MVIHIRIDNYIGVMKNGRDLLSMSIANFIFVNLDNLLRLLPINIRICKIYRLREVTR